MSNLLSRSDGEPRLQTAMLGCELRSLHRGRGRCRSNIQLVKSWGDHTEVTFADVFGSFTASLLTLLLFEDLEIFKLPTLLQLSFADDCAGDYYPTANGSGRGLRRCGDEKKHSMAAWDGWFKQRQVFRGFFLLPRYWCVRYVR